MRDLVSCYSEHAVKVSDASCSGSSSTGGGSIVSARDRPPVQSAVTCVYRSTLSAHQELLLRITWSKSLIGQGLSVEIDVLGGGSKKPASSNSLLLRKKKGSRSCAVGDSVVGLYWDISTAKYGGEGPEPTEGFYVVAVADGKLALLLGDMTREHVKKLDEKIPTVEFALVSRRERVVGSTPYTTRARFAAGGREHEISIRCCSGSGGEEQLAVCVDRKKVVDVQRLKWNFRGNQTIFVDRLPVDVMWDVHDWRFGSGIGSGAAVFMFRTRSALDSRLWLEEMMKSEFSLLIHAFKSP